jgi:Fe-S oxidoreductase
MEMQKKYRFEVDFGEQVLRCSVCGFCQAVCPIYGLTRRPALNARGKMLVLQEVMKGEMGLDEDLVETLFQCTGCASCEVNCPSGVKVTEILRQVRQDMVDIGTCHPAFTGMNELLQTKDNIYAEKDPPDYLKGRKVNSAAEHVYFAGCVGAYREPEATERTLDLLDRLGVDYTLIDEVCCSGILEEVGYTLHLSRAETIVDRVNSVGAKTLITGCPYCYRTFKHKSQYAGLAQSGVDIVHISQFLTAHDFGVTTDLVVTYHDPCDLGRHSGLYEEPRETIRKIAPNFKEMEHHHAQSLCCGAGGGVRGSYPVNSVAMARRRLAEAEAIGADVVLTECNSCVHNLSNAKLRRQKIKIFTTPQFIGQLLEEKE